MSTDSELPKRITEELERFSLADLDARGLGKVRLYFDTFEARRYLNCLADLKRRRKEPSENFLEKVQRYLTELQGIYDF